MRENNKLIHLGKCSKTHGLKGEFSLHLINHEHSNLGSGAKLILQSVGSDSQILNDQNFIIEKIRLGNKAILKLAGVDTIEAAEEMLPFNIYIDRKELPPLEEGEYYLSDLLGFIVVDINQKDFGTVHKFGFNGAQDILVIKTKSGVLEEIPMVKPFLQNIDLENKIITIEVPDYI